MRTSCAFAFAFVALAACNRSEDPAPAPDKPAAAQPAKRPSELEPPPATPAEVRPDKNAPTLVVVDPGQQPRSQLRITPKPDSAEMLELRMDMAMAMSLGKLGKQPRIEMPTMVTQAEVAVGKVEDGSIDYRAVFAAPRLEPGSDLPAPVLEQIKGQLSALEGMRGSFVVSDRGVLESGTMDIPDDLPAQNRQMLEQMTQNMRQISIPLPDEPVGPGARWSATTRLELGGLDLTQRAEYVLEGCEQSLCKLEVSISQTTEAEEFSPPQMPSMKAKIEAYESTGTGTIALDLNHVTPDESHVEISTHFAFAMEAMGEDQAMVMDMDLDMTIRRQEAG